MYEVRTRKIAISPKKESTYKGGAAADAKPIIDLDMSVFPEPDYDIEPNTHQLGRSIEPTKTRVLGKRHRVTLAQQWATPHFVGLMLAYVFGSEKTIAGITGFPTTTPVVGTDYRVHRFNTIQGRARPSFVMKEVTDSENDKGTLYKGCGGESAQLSGSIGQDRIIRANFGAVMAQRSASNSDIDLSVAANQEPSEGVLDGSGAKVYLGTGNFTEIDLDTDDDDDIDTTDDAPVFATTSLIGANADITEAIHSFDWNYNNNPSIGNLYRFGSGQTLGKWERGAAPTHGLQLDFTWKESEMSRYDNQTDLAFQISIPARTYSGVKMGLTLVLPKVTYTGFSHNEVDGERVISGTFQPYWGGGADNDKESAYAYLWNEQNNGYAHD